MNGAPHGEPLTDERTHVVATTENNSHSDSLHTCPTRKQVVKTRDAVKARKNRPIRDACRSLPSAPDMKGVAFTATDTKAELRKLPQADVIKRPLDIFDDGVDSGGLRETKNEHIPSSRVKTDAEKKSDFGDVELEEFFAEDRFFGKVEFT